MKNKAKRLELLTDARAVEAMARQPWVPLNQSLARAIELLAKVMEYLLDEEETEDQHQHQ